MLIPYGNCIHARLPKEFTYFSIELSPDGKLFAVSTEDYIQIWSAGTDYLLLCQVKIQKGNFEDNEQNRRVQIVWKHDSSQIAVICGNGVINILNVEAEECIITTGDSYSERNIVPCCKLGVVAIKNLSEYGSPLCACALELGFILGTSQGNLVEVEWSGISRGYPIVAPILIYLPDLAKDLSPEPSILSVGYNSTLKVISVVLESGYCILFHIAYNNRINFTGGFIVNADHCVSACMGNYSHLLAVADTSGVITVHRLQWVNESLMPRPVLTFDIHHYDDLYPPPMYCEPYQTRVTAMAWNWENDHLAVGYGDRCFAVWNFQENPIFWYSWKHSQASYDIRCCCFTSMGDAVIFNGGVQEEEGLRDTLITQTFLLSKNTQICRANSRFSCYNSNHICYFESHEGHSIMPVSIPITQDFLMNCNWPLLGMASNPSEDHMLLFTCSDICLYNAEQNEWTLRLNFVKESTFIATVCWLSDWLFAVAIHSPQTPDTITIQIFHRKTMAMVRDMKLVGSETMRMNEMVFDGHHLICLLNSILYIYTFAPSVNFTDPNCFILTVTNTQAIRLSPSTSVPLHILPVIGQLVKYRSRSRNDSTELFGVGKEQSDEDNHEDELQSILLLNHDFTADILNLKTYERKQLSDDVLTVFLIQSSDYPPFASKSVILYGTHRYNTWFPLLEPSPTVMKNWIGPKKYQLSSIPVGFLTQSWSTLALYNTFYRHSNEGSLVLNTTCILNSPLLHLLQASHPTEASDLLRYFYRRRIPYLLPALEFMFHSALNCAPKEVLHTTLHFLSAYPIFPQIVIGCLRKQERTTWPSALHNPLDILYLFRHFLNAGDTSFAMAIISVLQGVDCSASETVLPSPCPNRSQLTLWCNLDAILQHVTPSLQCIAHSFDWIWEDAVHADECVAHKAGIELLLVRLLHHQTQGLSDIYRYLLMEESRHEELGEPVPSVYQSDTILSTFVYTLLEHGMCTFALQIHRELGFTLKALPQCKSFYVMDTAEMIRKVVESLKLSLPPLECFDDVNTMHEQIRHYRAEQSIRQLIRLIESMEADAGSDWKIVFYFVTIDLEALLKASKQFADQWNKCVLDIQRSNFELFCNVVDTVQQLGESS